MTELKKVLITPRSFKMPVNIDNEGYHFVYNTEGRILRKEEMLELVQDVDAVIVGVDPFDKEVLEAATRLKIIAKYGVGTDNIDLKYAEELGIKVTTTVGANTQAVADYAMSLMMTAARNVVMIDSQCRAGSWNKKTGVDVFGSTLGLIGMGQIGKAVAKRAAGFDMKLLAYDMVEDTAFAEQFNLQYVSLETIFEKSDFISLHLPLTDATRHIIGRDAFLKMKKRAVIINTARGGLVDEDALIWALQNGEIWAAGIDVFEEEPPSDDRWGSLDNVILSSHSAASSFGAVNNMSRMSIQSVLEFFKEGVTAQ